MQFLMKYVEMGAELNAYMYVGMFSLLSEKLVLDVNMI